MDIEYIEKVLNSLYEQLKEDDTTVPMASIIPFMQCQVLLGIYHKLEDIEGRLDSIDKELWVRGGGKS
jgi:hypothetical protein